MIIEHGFGNRARYRGGYVSIGNFDGVHRGHQRMISSLVQHAHREGVPAVVLTFDPHPVTLLAPDRTPPRLSTLERKAALLADCGVDCLIAYPTDRELLNLTADEFFQQIVQQELAARGVVEGPNFCFGRNRGGTIAVLAELCAQAGILCEIVPAVTRNEQVVSSSSIRQALLAGEVREALEMLGHPYRLSGTVASGAGRGRDLGFPTANLDDVATLVPADGVYAAVGLVDDECLAAAVHIGSNPTFAENARKLEVHLLDYDGDLYGSTLHVDLIDRVRTTQSFDGPPALQEQLKRDLAKIRRIVDEHWAEID
ncbi:Riboflavin kinase [Maioricimonas rarisocia]|uniref:Riboflavin biosynthesis protein n=1 Tax=Maioricimonas rarisocia TaxID=2528026 RepID=A0A517Z9X2_9PLAN|nr:bifunctional riboflavin kinase/FAD synthetase [Maioricimonas rarisocia]QDU39286.1 Riboflavin kinase [Maioricimonas rarisocia]